MTDKLPELLVKVLDQVHFGNNLKDEFVIEWYNFIDNIEISDTDKEHLLKSIFQQETCNIQERQCWLEENKILQEELNSQKQVNQNNLKQYQDLFVKLKAEHFALLETIKSPSNPNKEMNEVVSIGEDELEKE